MGTQPTEQPAITMKVFLESAPPDTAVEVSDLARLIRHNIEKNLEIGRRISTPHIQLYCDSDQCSGIRTFDDEKGYDAPQAGQGDFVFLYYTCRNCRKNVKVYALYVRGTKTASGTAQKLGEFPPFGPHTPSRLITLIGKDRELFLQGRRAESRGFGIGAFAYYRQVVEHEKGRIIGEMGRVAERLGADVAVVAKFKSAAAEDRFSQAIDQVKDVIPPSLLIHGQNPLTLLHKALSEGLHEGDDAECLDRAKSVRLVLTELADRISEVLKDNSELRQAVAKLLASNQPKS